ncbi:hypothetical protein ACMZ4X_04390 [Achromobacter marplatensis]
MLPYVHGSAACVMGYVRHASTCSGLPERTPPILRRTVSIITTQDAA